MDKEIYSLTEVAKLKGKTRQAVDTWVKRNRIEIVTIGRYRGIKKADLEKIPNKLNG